jgi:hypothetical protein
MRCREKFGKYSFTRFRVDTAPAPAFALFSVFAVASSRDSFPKIMRKAFSGKYLANKSSGDGAAAAAVSCFVPLLGLAAVVAGLGAAVLKYFFKPRKKYAPTERV